MRESLSYPSSWIFIARLVSYLFHPLLVGVYMAAYMIFINPVYYNYVDPREKILSLATVFNNNFVFPLVVVLLLKGLGFIKSIYLETAKERIVPYMASIIFFFWTWYVFYNKPDAPQTMKDMLQGIFYASIIAMTANIYFKISMHAIGMGGLVGMMVVALFSGQLIGLVPLALAVLITGLVMTARMVTGDHQQGDMLAGFLVGFLAQMTAHYIV
jgi:hypothetical protein